MRVEVAKSKATGDPNVLAYGGQDYLLPPAMPLSAIEAMEQNSMIGFLRAMFDGQYDAFAADVNTEDLEAVAAAIAQMYGGDGPGESQASGGSS